MKVGDSTVFRDEKARVVKQRAWWASSAGLEERKRRSERMLAGKSKEMADKAISSIKSGNRNEASHSEKMKEWWNTPVGIAQREVASKKLIERNQTGQASRGACRFKQSMLDPVKMLDN